MSTTATPPVNPNDMNASFANIAKLSTSAMQNVGLYETSVEKSINKMLDNEHTSADQMIKNGQTLYGEEKAMQIIVPIVTTISILAGLGAVGALSYTSIGESFTNPATAQLLGSAMETGINTMAALGGVTTAALNLAEGSAKEAIGDSKAAITAEKSATENMLNVMQGESQTLQAIASGLHNALQYNVNKA